MRPHHPWLNKCVQRLNQLPQIHAIALNSNFSAILPSSLLQTLYEV